MGEMTISSSDSFPIHPSTDMPEALRPPEKRVSVFFIGSLTLAEAALFLCYTAAPGLLLPLQISQIDPANKIGNLGILTAIGAIMALFGNPIAGAVSDRTSSRFGRRRPWMVTGAVMSAAGLAIMMQAGNFALLLIGWCIFQFFSNFILATLNAVIPDQVPESQRGIASGMLGLAIPVGAILGAILIGQIIRDVTISYGVLIGALLVIIVPYGLLLRDKQLPKEYIPSFQLGTFLKGFWVSPRKHPDFGWAWITRFLVVLGNAIGTGYQFYYLQDVVKYEQHFPGQSILQGVSTLQIISTIAMIVFTVIGGFISDRTGRRKIFVMIASVIVAVTLLAYGFFPIWEILLVVTAISGLGFGVYLAVDLALVTQVLPSAKDRAKDLGIINIANTLPMSLAPVLASFVITQFHSYMLMFVIGTVVTLLGAILVQPIKGVR